MNLDPYLILYTKINPKWVIYQNVRAETIKLVKEYIGKISSWPLFRQRVLRIPRVRSMKEKKKSINWTSSNWSFYALTNAIKEIKK